MVNELKTGKDLVMEFGTSMYGEVFSLHDKDVSDIYQSTYNYFVKRSKGKVKKGLLVIGGLGVGKSAMMKIMQRIFKDTDSGFRWVNSYDLKDLSELYTVSQIKEMYGYDLKMDLYIDDIGIAVDVKRYGNTVNIITEILMERYDLFINSGFKTHISSNLLTAIASDNNSVPTLKSVYGARILDRIKEMTDVIKFKGDSQRK
jgi:DNA replication protein DnaC